MDCIMVTKTATSLYEGQELCSVSNGVSKQGWEIQHDTVTGRHTKTGCFFYDWAAGVHSNNACMGSLCCLCVEKVITIDNQVLHADMTGTNITFASPTPLCSLFFFVSLPLSHPAFLSLPISLCPLCSDSFRLAKFRQIPRGPNRHLGRSRVICVPGHRGAQTQNHLDEERQESQLPALWGKHSCVTVLWNAHIHTHMYTHKYK